MSLHPNPVQAPAPAASASPLVRLAGPAAVTAGVGLVVTQLVQTVTRKPDLAATVADPLYAGNAVAQFAVLCVLVVAAMGAYERQSQRARAFGVVGVVAAVVGTVNVAGNYWFEAFVTPWFAVEMPGYLSAEPAGMLLLGGATSYGFFALGWLLFGLASLRARVFPAAVSIGIAAAGAAAFLIGQPPMGVPLGLAVGALGLWIVRNPTTAGPA